MRLVLCPCVLYSESECVCQRVFSFALVQGPAYIKQLLHTWTSHSQFKKSAELSYETRPASLGSCYLSASASQPQQQPTGWQPSNSIHTKSQTLVVYHHTWSMPKMISFLAIVKAKGRTIHLSIWGWTKVNICPKISFNSGASIRENLVGPLGQKVNNSIHAVFLVVSSKVWSTSSFLVVSVCC